MRKVTGQTFCSATRPAKYPLLMPKAKIRATRAQKGTSRGMLRRWERGVRSATDMGNRAKTEISDATPIPLQSRRLYRKTPFTRVGDQVKNKAFFSMTVQ